MQLDRFLQQHSRDACPFQPDIMRVNYNVGYDCLHGSRNVTGSLNLTQMDSELTQLDTLVALLTVKNIFFKQFFPIVAMADI